MAALVQNSPSLPLSLGFPTPFSGLSCVFGHVSGISSLRSLRQQQTNLNPVLQQGAPPVVKTTGEYLAPKTRNPSQYHQRNRTTCRVRPSREYFFYARFQLFTRGRQEGGHSVGALARG
jgi:hypothetical protein